MKHLSNYSQCLKENVESNIKAKSRVLLVSGGDDYHALSFEQAYGGTLVKDIIDNISKYESDEWDLQVFTFASIDPRFVEFIRNEIQDYDDSKTKNFYLEEDFIK